jgi:dTDP-4-dehydrorhamnose 3,5-epimerase
MQIEPTALPDVKLVQPRRFGDERGYFVEVFNKKIADGAGLNFQPMQENQSFSRAPGTVRGLHYQRTPFVQAKIVRVLRGRIIDVAVDIRVESPSFGRWVSVELSADKGEQLYVPGGFAHGFCTLEPDTEIAYLVDNLYSPECDGVILWNDPAIGIRWPAPAGSVLSEKDRGAPTLAHAKIDGR